MTHFDFLRGLSLTLELINRVASKYSVLNGGQPTLCRKDDAIMTFFTALHPWRFLKP